MWVSVTKTLYCSLVRSHHQVHINRIESVQKKFVLFALGRKTLPDSYALPPYRDQLATLGLRSIRHRQVTSCALFIYDCLMGTIKSDRLRRKINVNSNRRGRHGRYLYERFHRTDYGQNEPISKCTRIFNKFADIFLAGLSRKGFIRAMQQRLMEVNFDA